MKTTSLFIFASFMLGVLSLKAQDTFSIVAVDSATGEVGSAGASCLGYTRPVVPFGALIISDVLPGIGVIHTQAQWDPGNQKYARFQMEQGLSPKNILKAVTENDAFGDSSIRQYGVVDLNGGHPRAAAFTGSGCSSYKNHIVGKYYAIQGNILLGKAVLDSMESRFLDTKGPLSDRLMAALQGAKMKGADTRCFAHNTSSLSSFIRVAKPGDDTSKMYINLYMSYSNTVSGNLAVDPIDSLQHMYTRLKAGIGDGMAQTKRIARLYYENSLPVLDLSGYASLKDLEVVLTDLQGRTIYRRHVTGPVFKLFEGDSYANGMYMYGILKRGLETETGKISR